MKLSRHIFLIGFMGTGKTTNAALLSRLAGVPRVEMDREIAAGQGMEVAEIFGRRGEEAFRDMETELLRRLSGEAPAVVSCGGGAVLREENVRIMRETGKIVLLTASPETILGRVKNGGERPVLNGRMDAGSITELMEKRRARYEEAADLTVDTDGKSSEEICAEILDLLRRGDEKIRPDAGTPPN